MKWFRDTGDLGVSSFQLRAIGRAWEGEEEEGGREREERRRGNWWSARALTRRPIVIIFPR